MAGKQVAVDARTEDDELRELLVNPLALALQLERVLARLGYGVQLPPRLALQDLAAAGFRLPNRILAVGALAAAMLFLAGYAVGLELPSP
jgi:hypothetical protein